MAYWLVLAVVLVHNIQQEMQCHNKDLRVEIVAEVVLLVAVVLEQRALTQRQIQEVLVGLV
jgi:predicted XRE-type DNA-binding protein